MQPEDLRPTAEILLQDAQRLKLLREMIESLPETYCQIMKLRYGQHSASARSPICSTSANRTQGPACIAQSRGCESRLMHT